MPVKDTQNYHELNEELQQLMTRLESGELDIDDAVTCYERGLAIVKLLETRLTRAENKIARLRAESDGETT